MIPLAAASCDGFLDTVPDDRIELDSKDKVTKMLVSAYPTVSTILISELSSDNVTDNGSQYDTYGQVCGDAYQWKDITTDDTDAPKSVWDAHYNAIAAANQALKAIEELGGGARTMTRKEARLSSAEPSPISSSPICSACHTMPQQRKAPSASPTPPNRRQPCCRTESSAEPWPTPTR